MNWRAPVDLYCERTDASLWSEPLNALTNGAFLIAAADAWRRMGPSAGADLRLLAALLALVGIGSFVFHTISERWASVLDVVFIALFVLVFVHRALVRLHGRSPRVATLGVLATIALSAALALSVHVPALNGSELYLGPWAALITLALTCPDAAARRWLGRASLLFLLSMVLRSIDLAVCAQWPLGTHCLWHLNNALVLWCGMRALIDQDQCVLKVS
ncbi:hypothetical protein G3580_01930 [Nitrogeniibacter mangrovi]|uniref:Ceramidase n=1 Tax=Nitrogeniibacter mangrovi TaxID=2016596 RepID=A0A6C1AYP8_9RHOO|nr:ceramidase domain-containing protein [Nitrogeniibacter mangrovi]QID16491.1 hypothetical protein G3580_01930 [Nitrogeniibacter mangrovi]